MRKFILKLLALGAPVLVVLLVLLWMPVEKKYAYQYLKGDFSKAGWIYERMFEQEDPVDVVFLGTSHTLNGVNDSLIEASLALRMGANVKVSNLSLNLPGANAHYAIFKDLLKKKKPKMLVLEVREVEARFSHFAFPIIADPEDVLLPEVLPNVYLFRDYLYALQSRYSYLKRNLAPEKYINQLWEKRTYGYLRNPKYISETDLEKARQEKLRSPKFYIGEGFRDIEFNMGKKYVEKIHRLAEENGVELVFLYLPYYGVDIEKPVEYNFYKQMGEVWFPPAEILKNPGHWADLYHLNDKAATGMADWLVERLQEYDHVLLNKGGLLAREQTGQ